MTDISASRVAAAAHLLLVQQAQTDFLAFVKLHHPEFDLQPFHLDLIQRLDDLAKGNLKHPETGKTVRNLIINMPPRHGKSQIATLLFPVFYMGLGRARKVMTTSYNSELAIDFGRRSRTYMDSAATRQAFPHLELRSDTRAAEDWNTTDGGRYVGIGLDGTTTGRAANLLVVDDPLKSRLDADSQSRRNRVWQFYASALSTRLEPTVDDDQPIQLIILTRWHPDDLVGRIQQTPEWKQGEWALIRYQALTETPTGPAALWPSRFGVARLEQARARDPREFEALYQQNPYVAGGNLLKSDWWQYYDPDEPQDYRHLILVADTAFKTRSVNDYSVLLIAGLTRTSEIHLTHLYRARLDFPTLKQRLITLNAVHRPRGLRAIYIEDKASGQSLIQEMRRESGLSVIPYKTPHDKVVRANSVAPLVEGGRVFLPRSAPWLDDFLLETTQFPSSPHDDQVDALTMALDILSRQSTGLDDSSFIDASTNSLTSSFSQYGKSLASLLGVSKGLRGLAR